MKRLIALLSVVTTFVALNAKGFDEQLELPEFNSGKPVWIIRAGVGFNGTVGSAKETQNVIWENLDWEGSFKSTEGYDVSFGFNKSFGNHPLYWGMDVAMGMRGYKSESEYHYSKRQSSGVYDKVDKTEDITLRCFNARLTPITIGYKYKFLDKMAADVHVGAYASYDFAGSYVVESSVNQWTSSKYGNKGHKSSNKKSVAIKDMDNMHKYDVGINVGVGYWFGHFNIDFTWQRGFVPIYEGGDKVIGVGDKKTDKREAGNFYSNNFQLRLGYAF